MRHPFPFGGQMVDLEIGCMPTAFHRSLVPVAMFVMTRVKLGSVGMAPVHSLQRPAHHNFSINLKDDEKTHYK